ncbi:hypothetical protein [Caulobacter endophyticus]|uniref:STAS domain-containing protein n=1 Tax=Caulobacter endophyticus TaxID=2172652 RepID=A0A2T9JGV2_9CAUL|nr:hypothetical protein [Caulobacter endophyticus]PVM82931.1 hypothetical protein DDF67_21835 [Caulobacter endophyticus]
MSLRLDGDVIRFEGQCRVEDTETLVALLHKAPEAKLDLAACQGMHAAVVQAMLAFGRPVVAWPTEGFLKDHLAPALAGLRPTKL